MSTAEPTTVIGGGEPGTVWDTPNQQVVRPDESAAWDEGDGGSTHPAEKAEEEEPPVSGYGAMTKADILVLAQSRGISPANATMTKDELIAALEADDEGF